MAKSKSKKQNQGDPFHGLHYLASLVLLCTICMGAGSFTELMMDLSTLEKYGLCVLLVIILHGTRGYIVEAWKWVKSVFSRS